mgnify:CR=1 FL=1
MLVAQAVAAKLVAAGKPGSIINVSSQMGHVGAAIRTVYCASKWAIEGLTKAMAVDLAPHGIRVNTLGPTFIETPLASKFLADPAFKSQVLSKIKLGRVGQVGDLTGAIVFLASDASSLMTGSSIVAGVLNDSPSAILTMVPRRILPERVFGSRSTNTYCRGTL